MCHRQALIRMSASLNPCPRPMQHMVGGVFFALGISWCASTEFVIIRHSEVLPYLYVAQVGETSNLDFTCCAREREFICCVMDHASDIVGAHPSREITPARSLRSGRMRSRPCCLVDSP
jgi:hypothetical protein